MNTNVLEISIDQAKENNNRSYSDDYLSSKRTFFESKKHETHQVGLANNKTIPSNNDLKESPLSSREKLTTQDELRYYLNITIV